jgi:hypothetical protein
MRKCGAATWIWQLNRSMKVKLRCIRYLGPTCLERRNCSDATCPRGGITVIYVQRNADPRCAYKTESLRSLLRNHRAAAATDEIGIQEAAARDKTWVRDRRRAHPMQRCDKRCGETGGVRVCPAARPLRCNV